MFNFSHETLVGHSRLCIDFGVTTVALWFLRGRWQKESEPVVQVSQHSSLQQDTGL